MSELETIALLNQLKDGIYLYNWIVQPSPLGLPWVRLRGYSCISFEGEMQPVQDFDAEEMRVAFENNQGVANPEDFLNNLDRVVKCAGPARWVVGEGVCG